MGRETSFILYGRSSCPYCIRAVDLLSFAGLEHDFFDLEEDREFLQEVKEYYNYKTVPIILKIDGSTGQVKFLGGCSDLEEWLND